MRDIKLRFSHYLVVIIVNWLLISSLAVGFADEIDDGSEIESKQEFYERPLDVLNVTGNANSTVNMTLPQTTAENIAVNYETPSTTPSNVIVTISYKPAETPEELPNPSFADSIKASRFRLTFSVLAVLLSLSWSYKTDFF